MSSFGDYQSDKSGPLQPGYQPRNKNAHFKISTVELSGPDVNYGSTNVIQSPGFNRCYFFVMYGKGFFYKVHIALHFRTIEMKWELNIIFVFI